MSLAEELAVTHGLKHRGTDYPLEDAVAAINEALERAAQEAETFVGKPCVASHVAFRIRALKSPKEQL